MSADSKHYTAADNIKVLEGLEAVRKRPGMYIGSTGERGLHHLVYEVVDNSIDESLAGYCTKITVILHKDNSVSVEDNGRGIPVDYVEKYKKSGVEIVMTILHAGGKFDESAYKVSGGLHGVGVSVVNALSEDLEVWVYREGQSYYQKYNRGKALNELKVLGKSPSEKTGTKVKFLADFKIFETLEYKYEIVAQRLRELAFLNKGVYIELFDERSEKKDVFHYEGGLIETRLFFQN
ncbi:MAG TPA: ATP-binding protein, partial [bacterium]|nr:ATP-binding protein [bacterium]